MPNDGRIDPCLGLPRTHHDAVWETGGRGGGEIGWKDKILFRKREEKCQEGTKVLHKCGEESVQMRQARPTDLRGGLRGDSGTGVVCFLEGLNRK